MAYFGPSHPIPNSAPSGSMCSIPAWRTHLLRRRYNATVRVGAWVEKTDANGFYALFGLAPGTASVRAEATGYISAEQATTITAGRVSSLHFALTR